MGMRVARLVGAFLAVAITALVVAPATGAEAPFRLPGQITDRTGALDPAGQAAVRDALDGLYQQHRVRLWVVYVDDFAGRAPEAWGRSTIGASGLGERDALLAVAVADRSYAFLVSAAVPHLGTDTIDQLRRDRIEPALHRDDWAGAAVVAADGLGTAAAGSPMNWRPVLIGVAALAAGLAVLVAVSAFLRRRRRRAEVVAAERLDATDPAALAPVSLPVLEELSRSKVVGVDNAVRTSTNELELAVEEFGEARTVPFTAAVTAARAALSRAFDVRTQLDDAIPETPAQQRELLTGVIVAAARADRELEAQRAAFEALRDLVINAPDRLDALTRAVVELTAREPAAEERLARLRTEFAPSALASVADNTATARSRVSFAETNIARARRLAGQAVSGRQGELVDCIRAAESALGQARSLLDGVDSAAADIRHARTALPDAIADLQDGITRADTAKAGAHAAALAAARTAAVNAIEAARTATDPLAAFARVTDAATELDRLLDVVAEERAAAERLARRWEQALFNAQARVRSASDFIDTRRGSVGPEARTKLAEARRELEAARGQHDTDLRAAIERAGRAASTGAQAQVLAGRDVRSAERRYAARYGRGDDTAALAGGIIFNFLTGAMQGGARGYRSGSRSGGWRSSSFGGSSSSGGSFHGGGGRF